MAKYFKLIAENRKARFDFSILDTYKAGIVLRGSEVKSIRLGRVNLKDSFGRVDGQKIYIYNMHISPYQTADQKKLDPIRPREILLNNREISRLMGQVAEKGLTLVPLKIFFDGNWAKIELGLAKAKRKYEKREVIRRKSDQREIEKAFKGKAYGSKKQKIHG